MWDLTYFIRYSPYRMQSGEAVILPFRTVSMLWNDDSGEISEYALVLGLILLLGIALISQTGTALKRLYQRVSSHQTTSVIIVPRKK